MGMYQFFDISPYDVYHRMMMSPLETEIEPKFYP